VGLDVSVELRHVLFVAFRIWTDEQFATKGEPL
jgi:hypothetical protein